MVEIVMLALADTTNKASLHQTPNKPQRMRKGYSTQFKVVLWKVKNHRPLGIYQGLLRFINSQSMSWCIEDTLAPQASVLSSTAGCLSS